MTEIIARSAQPEIDSGWKFRNPLITAEGKPRAQVPFAGLRTLWFNTGTLCNVTCAHCYIESSPTNDALVYLSREEMAGYLDELDWLGCGAVEIGFTGGEPFMNPHLVGVLGDSLERGHRALVLTNAMRPMMKCAVPLLDLRERYGTSLTIRVSLDHFRPEVHEAERGRRSWAPALAGLRWLSDNGFDVHVASRLRWGDGEESLRRGFAKLFASRGIRVNADSASELVLFPEMDAEADVPEITADCWSMLGVNPGDLMCAHSRMVVKRRGAAAPEVVSCTLQPFAAGFRMGRHLGDAGGGVALNHPHCAKFCVLGGGKCSA